MDDFDDIFSLDVEIETIIVSACTAEIHRDD